MRCLILSALLVCCALGAAATAAAQAKFACVLPDGRPVAAIVLPMGVRADPSVVCNAVVPQCYLTCGAVEHRTLAGFVVPPDVPVVHVTPEMLHPDSDQYTYESPAYCEQQYQTCLARCRGNRDCAAACRSVRSGCGRGNPSGRHGQ